MSHKYNVPKKSWNRQNQTIFYKYIHIIKLYRKSRRVERERHNKGKRSNQDFKNIDYVSFL